MVQCPYIMRVHFYPEIIYFFSIQFSLKELSLKRTFQSMELLTTYHPENRKKISIISEFDENFLGH